MSANVSIHYKPTVVSGVRNKRAVVVEVVIPPPEEPPKKKPKIAMAVCLCLDTSGSMQGKPMRCLKAAAKAVVSKFEPEDVWIVTFSNHAQCLRQKTKEGLVALIDVLEARGSTSIKRALEMATSVLGSRQATRQIFLLTDGVPNIDGMGTKGDGDPAGILYDAKHSDCPVTTFGLGNSYDDKLLLGIAQASGGGFFDIRDPSAVEKAIPKAVSLFRKLEYVNTRLSIRGINGAMLESFFCDDDHVANTTEEWIIGDLYQGDATSVLCEISIPVSGDERKEGEQFDFFVWKLTAKRPASDTAAAVIGQGRGSITVDSGGGGSECPMKVQVAKKLHAAGKVSREIEGVKDRKKAIRMQKALIKDLEVLREEASDKVKVVLKQQQEILKAMKNREKQSLARRRRQSEWQYAQGTQRNSSYQLLSVCMEEDS